VSKWVETGSGPRDKWLEFDFNGKKAFVWAGNLKSSARDNSIVSPNDKSKSEVAESDKSQDSPTQSLELAPGVYSRSEICRSEDYSKQCANQTLLKSLCESIESINDYYLESSAQVYSMIGWINVPKDAIRHLIDNDQVFALKIFYDEEKANCLISFKLKGLYEGTYYNTRNIYAQVSEFKVFFDKEGRKKTIASFVSSYLPFYK
jgi:hypothetical protein